MSAGVKLCGLLALVCITAGALGAGLPYTIAAGGGDWAILRIDTAGSPNLTSLLIVFDGVVDKPQAIAFGRTGPAAATVAARTLPGSDWNGYAWEVTLAKATGGPGTYIAVAYRSKTVGVTGIVGTGGLAVFFFRNETTKTIPKVVFFFEPVTRVVVDALGEDIEDLEGNQPGIGFRVTVALAPGDHLAIVYHPNSGVVRTTLPRKALQ